MISLVYPYMAQLSSEQDTELELSIRSMCKNLKFDFNVVIVGDKPKWYNGDHIYANPIRGIQFTRAFDIANKLSLIVNSDLITDDFIYCYDDIYALQPISLEYFDEVVAQCDENSVKLNGSGKWNRMLQESFNRLNIEQKWNYETHLPRKFNKQKLAKIITSYNLHKNPLLFSTLYYNEYFDKPTLMANDVKCQIYSKTSINDIDQKATGKLWLNHGQNGWNGSLKRYLINLFPDRCYSN